MAKNLLKLAASPDKKLTKVFNFTPENSGTELKLHGTFIPQSAWAKAVAKAQEVNVDKKGDGELSDEVYTEATIEILIPNIEKIEGFKVKTLTPFMILDADAVREMGGLDADIVLDPNLIDDETNGRVVSGEITAAQARAEVYENYVANLRYVLTKCPKITAKISTLLGSLHYFQDKKTFEKQQENL